jgi:hypothetical protein
MGNWKTRARDIVELLKEQRKHVTEGARVLEAIISHCSELAHNAPAGKLQDVASRLRDNAISMYAVSKNNIAAITELLERAIADLEEEVALGSA